MPEEPRRFTRGRLSRGKGLRKTTGCVTCRRRHVKCDEVKPRCGGCERRNVGCEYTPSPSRTNRPREDRRQSKVYGSTNASAKPVRNEDGEQTLGPREVSSSADVSLTTDPPMQTGKSLLHFDNAGQLVRTGHAAKTVEDTSSGSNVALNDDERVTSANLTQEQANRRTFSRSLVDLNCRQEYGAGQGTSHPPQAHAFGNDGASLTTGLLAQCPLPYACTPEPGTGQSDSSPTARWLDLLIADAATNDGMQTDLGFGVNGLDIFDNSVIQTPAGSDRETPAEEPQSQRDIIPRGHEKNTVISKSAYLQERIACAGDSAREKEKQAWRTLEPIRLQPQEHILFRHFAEHISQWMDLFDPQKPFGTLVPHLALHNVGLMNAILALSARHLGIVNRHAPTCAGGFRPGPSDTISFYYRTLRHSHAAMRHDTYKTSLELLAGALVISSYEMLDGSGADDWGKHLKGVFWIQRSQVIHGDSGGLRQAVWWAWVCQDAWAAFRERRKPFTFWQPARGVAELSPSELAARSVYNFAQVVGYCAAQDKDTSPKNDLERSLEADVLLKRLGEWKAHLTVEFEPLPLPASPETDGGGFEPVWIRPAAFGVAMQIYYCSLILVHLNRPCPGGTASHLARQRNFRKWANIVCGIAQSSGDYGSSVMSTQCAFIAGMVLEDDRQRSAVLDLISACSQRAGWPGYSLERELKQIWQQE